MFQDIEKEGKGLEIIPQELEMKSNEWVKKVELLL